MKTIERWLIKLTIIQVILLLVTQFFLHNWDPFHDLQKVALYEGVHHEIKTPIFEVMKQK
ncbi:hypothetical protein J2S13_000108 [Oikeobacillus pervagus]|uniref:YpfB family protein n=1 Tax=Oikeobacillus pervagus TaxID=1325931 RepID=A0AAJ1T0K0_9BACI|nr:DUF5359 family protein [Oikeobacillus pervagus]MDQ0213714.1 hypothetical protein [Oikeobacillus pervagus]